MRFGSIINKIKGKFQNEQKSQFITAFVAVFIWGILAHAYGILNLTISHDSLQEFYASNSDILHRVGLGRFMVPIYQLVFHGRVSLPWLNGLLSLCWLSLGVWLTAYIFSIRDKIQIVLIAGIFTVNITVTALTATYIHDLDADMFSVLLAICSVLLWYRGRKSAWFSIPLLVMVLGFYQSNLSVSIALVMFSSILTLLQGEDALKVVKKGLSFIGITIIAGAIYLFAVKLSCSLAGIELSSAYNGLTLLFESKGGLPQFLRLMIRAYNSWIEVFTRSSHSLYCMLFLHSLLALPVVIAVVHAIGKEKLPVINKILVLALGSLLPLGMNISYLADGGMVHDLMFFAAWLIYLLAILMANWYIASSSSKKRLPRLCYIVTFLTLLFILYTDVQTANCAYVKKDLERQSTLSIMAMVSADIEKTENYVAGETEVIFTGTPQTGTYHLFPYLSRITGLGSTSQITYYETYYSYFSYILQNPIRKGKNNIPKDFTESMAAFPKQGYIQWYGDTLVVKLSN